MQIIFIYRDHCEPRQPLLPWLLSTEMVELNPYLLFSECLRQSFTHHLPNFPELTAGSTLEK